MTTCFSSGSKGCQRGHKNFIFCIHYSVWVIFCAVFGLYRTMFLIGQPIVHSTVVVYAARWCKVMKYGSVLYWVDKLAPRCYKDVW